MKKTEREAKAAARAEKQKKGTNDGDLTPRNLRECEAESVALLCCAALGLPGVEFSRGYIQNWWGQGNPILVQRFLI